MNARNLATGGWNSRPIPQLTRRAPAVAGGGHFPERIDFTDEVLHSRHKFLSQYPRSPSFCRAALLPATFGTAQLVTQRAKLFGTTGVRLGRPFPNQLLRGFRAMLNVVLTTA